ncbi:hypothetical protein Asppvi_007060 [Aspergillus pseudoviridinutans]|uniref:CRAL-TRIO domain-containing protein n=1 Tax=Aspergillus pseudoviridinutans TaxID=1517512 RepID=A0A9P3BGZ4_9EURO|nr:uncharacterized protein Asppvi_007060 [Aspergillus pseudoviridinutans]GIJ88143.1 hypothetical protein Asppvi_007060 [Aspergillus pseudoviridinutans]
MAHSATTGKTLDLFKKLLRGHGFQQFSREQNTDDNTLMRFLAAKQFDLQAACRQFEYFQKWRREHQIRHFYEELDVDAYELTRQMYPQWIGRRDRDGRPVYVFPVRYFTRDKLVEYLKLVSAAPKPASHEVSPVPAFELHFHALYENLLQFVLPLTSELPRPDMSRPVSSSTHIVDISGVSLQQWWSIRQYLQLGSTLATAHYPETLGRVFVVGAPAFFRSIWELISRWFDPGTRAKISILSSSEAKSVLLRYIDASDLPQEYGGSLEWKWKDQPSLDPAARVLVDELYHKTDRGEVFHKGPVIFQDGCIRLLGSVKGKPRRNAFCRV